MVIVFIQLVLAISLVGVFSGRMPETDKGDDWRAAEAALRDLVMGIVCLIISVMMFLVCCVGCCTICFRNCWLLGLLAPLTLACSIGLLTMGAQHDRIMDWSTRTICGGDIFVA